MKSAFGLVMLGFVAVAGVASAENAATHQDAADHAAKASAVSGEGVVRQVKPEKSQVKISHDPIAALDWPAMTMMFRVKDKALLEGVGAGDKVRFDLEKDASGLVITRIEKAAK